MKRITVVTPANGVWTLPSQPFHRCLLLATISGFVSSSSTGLFTGKIQDVSGNVIWQTAVRFTATVIVNITFSDQGVRTDVTGLLSGIEYRGMPLPPDLTIPANLVLSFTIDGWTSGDTTPNLVLTTDDPFLDGARPFDDLQAP
jgi:hypothetical protein